MKPAALLCCFLSACASTTPEWDHRFGDTARMAWSRQVLHPEAARDTNAVAGTDGRTAASAYQSYLKSFSNPQQPAGLGIGEK